MSAVSHGAERQHFSARCHSMHHRKVMGGESLSSVAALAPVKQKKEEEKQKEAVDWREGAPVEGGGRKWMK